MDYKAYSARLNELRAQRIKIEDLQDRKLYRLLARNIKIGVWNAARQEFLGIREKFGRRFIDAELHWDAPAFATAAPIEVLGELPEHIALDDNIFRNTEFFSWLEEQENTHANKLVIE